MDLITIIDSPRLLAIAGAVATLMAATVGAVTALVVAGVNAWSAARLEARKAEREWRATLVRPIRDHVQACVAAYMEIGFAVHREDMPRAEELWEDPPGLGDNRFRDIQPTVPGLWESMSHFNYAVVQCRHEIRDALADEEHEGLDATQTRVERAVRQLIEAAYAASQIIDDYALVRPPNKQAKKHLSALQPLS